MLHHFKSLPIPFYGFYDGGETSSFSALNFQEEKYRAELVSTVEKLAAQLEYLSRGDLAQKNHPGYLFVKKRLEAKIMAIPPCWQENQDVLHELFRGDGDGDGGGGSGWRRALPAPPGLGVPQPGPGGAGALALAAAAPSSYESAFQVFHHITRDWTDDGAEIREQLYLPIVKTVLSEYEKHLVVDPNTPFRVLVPGCGLGRLAAELAAALHRGWRGRRGGGGGDKGGGGGGDNGGGGAPGVAAAAGLPAAVEAADLSVPMLAAAHALLNRLLPSGRALRIFPYLHDDFANEIDSTVRFKPVEFPTALDKGEDKASFSQSVWPLLEEEDKEKWRQTLSFQRAEFLSHYTGKLMKHRGINANTRLCCQKCNPPGFSSVGWVVLGEDSTKSIREYEGSYQAITTCFFVDTAINILDYVAQIEKLLSPGGLWVNVGPLQYHQHSKIILTLDEVQRVAELLGFVLLQPVTIISCAYRSVEDTENSLKPLCYQSAHFVYQKRMGASDSGGRDHISSDDARRSASIHFLHGDGGDDSEGPTTKIHPLHSESFLKIERNNSFISTIMETAELSQEEGSCSSNKEEKDNTGVKKENNIFCGGNHNFVQEQRTHPFVNKMEKNGGNSVESFPPITTKEQQQKIPSSQEERKEEAACALGGGGTSNNISLDDQTVQYSHPPYLILR